RYGGRSSGVVCRGTDTTYDRLRRASGCCQNLTTPRPVTPYPTQTELLSYLTTLAGVIGDPTQEVGSRRKFRA
ncbi:MAG: hypothetical protein ACREVF_09075, partial [Burkholderiales bacterium]